MAAMPSACVMVVRSTGAGSLRAGHRKAAVLAIGRRGVNRCRLYRGEWLREAPQAHERVLRPREVGEQRRDFEAPQRRLEAFCTVAPGCDLSLQVCPLVS